ncbi:ankyrin repeat domain-containing protein 34B [Clupea harengus]|uniref:Ankyrin repeat domain-containing protein 34B n=1 Tax=Clupea harengus TaxID=7950 RepID=A0A6P3WDQ7_CLUHA|nr:ankyrin repeat domain-containing protein 34B [Clupea harengus]
MTCARTMKEPAMDGTQAVHTDGSSLLKAVYLGRLRLTRLLLEGGAYINESNDLGETPLMVACKSKHVDQQSVSKAKMVRYLLESDADPNIQDKSGKTALMHACLERVGSEVVSQLLESGADPSLEDHSGSSALVRAVNAKDKETLKMLMDACKAKGKEVIIITTDKMANGEQMTKQYLNVPPVGTLERWDQPNSPALSCTSPSEIELHTPGSSANPQNAAPKQVFSFQDCKGVTNSQPSSPCRQWGVAHELLEKSAHLQRLNSEPWLQIPPSFLAQQQSGATFPIEDLPDISPEEEFLFRTKPLAFSSGSLTRHWSIDLREAGGLSQTGRPTGQAESVTNRGLRQVFGLMPGRKMSFDGLSSPHSLSHPNLHAKTTVEPTPADRDPDKSLPNLAVSNLRNIICRRNLGMDHYGSDSQLSFQKTHTLDDVRGAVDRKRLVTSRSSTFIGSRESLEGTTLTPVPKRHPAGLERRSSGLLLSDLPSHPRQGYLPPLNPHTLTPCMVGVNASGMPANNKLGCGTLSGVKPCYPQAPASFQKEPRSRRMLLRRHSMQTEQIKQLGDFKELYGH